MTMEITCKGIIGGLAALAFGAEHSDVRPVGCSQLFHVGRALGLGLGGDLVGVDGVDLGLGAHDGDAGLGWG